MEKGVKVFDGSDYHLAPKVDYDKASDTYKCTIPELKAAADYASSKGADVFLYKGDLLEESEDHTISYAAESYKEKLENFIQAFLDEKEVFLSEVGSHIMSLGGLENAKLFAEQNSDQRSEVIKHYISVFEDYGEKDVMSAVKKRKKWEPIGTEVLKEDYDNYKNLITTYFKDFLAPAVKEALSNFNGKKLFVDGNHDVGLFNYIHDGQEFISLDKRQTPLEIGPLRIAGAANLPNYNCFPREFIELYDKNGEFDILQKQVEQNVAMYLQSDPEFNKLSPEMQDDHFKRILQEEMQNAVPQSPVFKRLENNDFNFLVNHNGALPHLRAHDFDPKQDLGGSGIGLEAVVMEQIQKGNLDVMSAGHVHENKIKDIHLAEHIKVQALRTGGKDMHSYLYTVEEVEIENRPETATTPKIKISNPIGVKFKKAA